MDTPEQSVIAYKKRLEARRLYPANGKFAEGDEAFKRPNEGRLPRRFAKVEQRLRVPQGALNVHDALAIVCELALMPEYKKNFDEGVEIAIGLSVDPRKPNNQIRGACELPEGTGKTFRVAAFGLDPEQLAAAEAAGAAAFGGEDLIERVANGYLDFDVAVASKEIMPKMASLGRVLGPRKLMPNPKTKTVVADLGAAVAAQRGGKTRSFKVDTYGIVHAGLGRVSFGPARLAANVRALMVAIQENKPEAMSSKGKFFKRVHLSSSMGPGVEVDVSSLNPMSPRFMKEPEAKRPSDEGGAARGEGTSKPRHGGLWPASHPLFPGAVGGEAAAPSA